jgi:hypothetical protein
MPRKTDALSSPDPELESLPPRIRWKPTPINTKARIGAVALGGYVQED